MACETISPVCLPALLSVAVNVRTPGRPCLLLALQRVPAPLSPGLWMLGRGPLLSALSASALCPFTSCSSLELCCKFGRIRVCLNAQIRTVLILVIDSVLWDLSMP